MSSVIVAGAVIGAVVGGGSSLMGIKRGNRSQIKAFKKQMQYLQMNYNYNQAALDRQERSMYDSAMVELFNLSVNAHQNNAQIEAALAETGTEGRSSKKIEQTVHGQTARQETAIKEAYTQQVWDVRGKKDALYISTKADVDQSKDVLRSNLVGGLPAFMQVLNSAAQGAAIGAATAGAGSALGSALSSGASTATTSALGSAAANTTGSGALVAGGVQTSLGSGFLSSAGYSTLTGATGAGAGAITTGSMTGSLALGASSGLADGLGSGTLATQVASTGTATSGASSSFLANFNTAMAKYKPYINMYNSFSKIGNALYTNTRRGGYYY